MPELLARPSTRGASAWEERPKSITFRGTNCVFEEHACSQQVTKSCSHFSPPLALRRRLACLCGEPAEAATPTLGGEESGLLPAGPAVPACSTSAWLGSSGSGCPCRREDGMGNELTHLAT